MGNLVPLGSILRKLPPLKRHRDPSWAAVIGFLTGGVGLGIYFRSVLDALMPIAIVILLASVVGPAGALGGALVAALYGYFRAASSNEVLGAQEHLGETPKLPERVRAGKIDLDDLIEAQVLTPGSRVFAEHAGRRYEAKVVGNGKLAVEGLGSATSPSGAAELVRGRRTNGWNYWKIQTTTGVVRLASLRDELSRRQGREVANG